MRRRTAVLLAAASLALAPVLTACGEEQAAEPKSAVPESAAYNDADLAFATEMIPHHAEALSMVDLTSGKQLSPEVAALAEQIRAARAPEIEDMTSLLEDWDEPVPANPRDHANAGHGSGGHGVPGMEELESAQGAAFEQAFLEAMVEHHERAVDLAEQEVADGEDADALALAEQIAASQQAELERMEQLLRR